MLSSWDKVYNTLTAWAHSLLHLKICPWLHSEVSVGLQHDVACYANRLSETQSIQHALPTLTTCLIFCRGEILFYLKWQKKNFTAMQAIQMIWLYVNLYVAVLLVSNSSSMWLMCSSNLRTLLVLTCGSSNALSTLGRRTSLGSSLPVSTLLTHTSHVMHLCSFWLHKPPMLSFMSTKVVWEQ